MTADEAVSRLREETNLEVRPHAIQAALTSRPNGDADAAVEQVIEWVERQENRSREAGVLLLAALKGQAQRPRERGKTDWAPLQADARRLLPSEPEPFVIGAIQMLRATGQPVTPQAIRDRLKAQGRTKAQLSEEAA